MAEHLTEYLHEANCPTHGEQNFTEGLKKSDIDNIIIDKCTYEGCSKKLVKIQKITTQYDKKTKKIISKKVSKF